MKEVYKKLQVSSECSQKVLKYFSWWHQPDPNDFMSDGFFPVLSFGLFQAWHLSSVQTQQLCAEWGLTHANIHLQFKYPRCVVLAVCLQLPPFVTVSIFCPLPVKRWSVSLTYRAEKHLRKMFEKISSFGIHVDKQKYFFFVKMLMF